MGWGLPPLHPAQPECRNTAHTLLAHTRPAVSAHTSVHHVTSVLGTGTDGLREAPPAVCCQTAPGCAISRDSLPTRKAKPSSPEPGFLAPSSILRRLLVCSSCCNNFHRRGGLSATFILRALEAGGQRSGCQLGWVLRRTPLQVAEGLFLVSSQCRKRVSSGLP